MSLSCQTSLFKSKKVMEGSILSGQSQNDIHYIKHDNTDQLIIH